MPHAMGPRNLAQAGVVTVLRSHRNRTSTAWMVWINETRQGNVLPLPHEKKRRRRRNSLCLASAPEVHNIQP